MFQRIVRSGLKQGRTIGYPTLNLEVGDLHLHLEEGVYTCHLQIRGETYLGMMHFGPKMNSEAPVLEIFVQGFEGDLYGQTVQFNPLQFVRKPMNFDSLEALKAQIEADLKYLNA